MGNKVFVLIIMAVLLIQVASALTIDSFSTNPDKVKPGEAVSLSLSLVNNLKDNAESVSVALDLTNLPFAPFESSSEQSIDKIKVNGDESFQFRLIADNKAASGAYKIPVKISYLIKDTKQEKIGFVSVIVNSEAKIRVVAEGYLIRGTEGEINVRIVNDGLSDVKFVSVSAASGNYKINSPTYDYLGSLSSDDFDSVSYKIYTSSSASSIGLPVTIVYTDSENKEHSINQVLGVSVYTTEEAQARGLISTPSHTIYYAVAIVIIIFFLYRFIKDKKRKLKDE